MKTQILKSQISKAILLAMMIALAAPAANAQRREASQTEKSKKVEQSTTSHSNRSSQTNNKYESSRNAKSGVTQRRESNTYKKDQNHQDRGEKYAHHGNKDWKKHKDRFRYDRHASINVHVNPPVFTDWNVYAHHHRHISFRRVPRKAIWINLDGDNLLVHRGKFYRPSPMGFYRVKPPRYINSLPDGCNLLWVKGQKFFNFHGVLFIDTPLGFKIIAS